MPEDLTLLTGLLTGTCSAKKAAAAAETSQRFAGGGTEEREMRAVNEVLMEIHVTILDAVDVEGARQKVVMIPFTAEAEGPYFTGKTTGPCVDTQRIDREGKTHLSARYMLEGRDAAGNMCRVFVENQGTWETGFVPTIVTDSPLLADWETAALKATVEGVPGGVLVRISRANEK